MKQHDRKGKRKVLKQMKKCNDIDDIISTAEGYKIILKTGEFYVTHLTAGAFHPVRKWLKKHTSLKNLSF